MRRVAVFLLLPVLLIATAVPAYAQSTRRPDLNLFGRGFRDASQQLSVSGNLGATFYDVIKRRSTPVNGREIPDHGWGNFASAAIGYRLNFPNISFDGSAGVVARYYPGIDTQVQTQYLPGVGTRLGWTFDLTDRTQFSFGSGLRYRPAYAESLLGSGFGTNLSRPTQGLGGIDATSAFLPPDSAFASGNYLASDSGAGLRHRLSRRWSATADYSYRRDILIGGDDEDNQEGDGDQPGVARPGRRDGWTQHGGAALHFALTQNLSIRAGYGYSEAHFGEDRPHRSHTADVGIDYGEATTLQLTRHTTLSLSGGVSALADRNGRQQFHVIGDVNLVHDIGRTWSSTLSFSRNISSTEILLQEPVLRDEVRASLNGLLSRRVGFHAIGWVTRGSVGLVGAGNGHTGLSASTGLQSALHRQVALSVDYTYYQYQFGSAVTRPLGFSDRSASQGVHAYLSLWAPIFQRRGNASR